MLNKANLLLQFSFDDAPLSNYKGHKKRNEPEAFNKKRAGVWNVQSGGNIAACVTKSDSDKSAGPPL